LVIFSPPFTEDTALYSLHIVLPAAMTSAPLQI